MSNNMGMVISNGQMHDRVLEVVQAVLAQG
jgi:hypothetical protein